MEVNNSCTKHSSEGRDPPDSSCYFAQNILNSKSTPLAKRMTQYSAPSIAKPLRKGAISSMQLVRHTVRYFLLCTLYFLLSTAYYLAAKKHLALDASYLFLLPDNCLTVALLTAQSQVQAQQTAFRRCRKGAIWQQRAPCT